MTSALIGAETVVLVLLSVLVVGLLRSHAEILRRLERQSGAELPSPTDSSAAGGRAHDLHGSTPSGGVRRVAMSPGSPSTLLAFLSTNCSSCAQLLESLEAGPPPLPAATRLVVVTRDPSLERARRFLAIEDVTDVVMSSAAWVDYAVPGSPYFVYTDGKAGAVAGEGSATTWSQVTSLLIDAIEDTQTAGPEQHPSRVDTALAAAGIRAGNPSLHPSGASTGETA